MGLTELYDITVEYQPTVHFWGEDKQTIFCVILDRKRLACHVCRGQPTTSRVTSTPRPRLHVKNVEPNPRPPTIPNRGSTRKACHPTVDTLGSSRIGSASGWNSFPQNIPVTVLFLSECRASFLKCDEHAVQKARALELPIPCPRSVLTQQVFQTWAAFNETHSVPGTGCLSFPTSRGLKALVGSPHGG